MKKVLSFVLALALVLALAAPAFAGGGSTPNVTAPDATTGAYGANAEITGTTEAPTIKLTIPTTGSVVVNPYKMTVTVDSTDYTDQVVSAAQFIKNESDVDVAIDVTTTGEVGTGSEAVFATTTVGPTVTTKSVFLYFEIMASTDDSTAPTWATAYDSKSASMIPVSAKATTKKDTIKLGAGDTTATYAAFHLAGNAATNPAKPWTATDTVNVKLAFTVRPAVATA